MILCHPYFWGHDHIPSDTMDPLYRLMYMLLWKNVCPTCELDDPWINSATNPNLARVATPRLQVFVSEFDGTHLRERGWYYARKMRQSGWSVHQEVIDF
ncbi:hypothetical protein Q3G72_000040 [Acer saccharum]|nr:hypothetical protein Q3G72_000040 [Acer saccharum]